MKFEVLELSRKIHSGKIDQLKNDMVELEIFDDLATKAFRLIAEVEINNFHGNYKVVLNILGKIDSLGLVSTDFIAQYAVILRVSTLWKLGRYHEAQSLLTASNDREDLHLWIQNELTRQQALVLFLMGDLTIAIALVTRVLNISTDILQTAKARNNLGYFLRYQGNTTESKQHHLQALPILIRYRQIIPMANCLENIAIINMLQGNFAESIGRMQQSLSLREETGNSFYLSGTLFHLIQLTNTSDKWKELQSEYMISLQEIVETSTNKVIELRYELVKELTKNPQDMNFEVLRVIWQTNEAPIEIRMYAFLALISYQFQDKVVGEKIKEGKIAHMIKELQEEGFKQSNLIITIHLHLFLALLENYEMKPKRSLELLNIAKILAETTGIKELMEKVNRLEEAVKNS